jgi:flavin reductase (DIM6/NTAB) family NADH-FMN oxidoreductase RutF
VDDLKIELSERRRLQPGPAGVVVLATCQGLNSKPNIITLGMYMPISIRPPMVCIGVSPLRYSHQLIEKSGEFVINTPPITIEKEMHFCGIESGIRVDKFSKTGLTPIPSLKVRPPRIKECFGHIECKVVQKHTCGDHTLFVGEAIPTSADAEVMNGESLDVLKARPIIQKNHVYFTVKRA